MSESEPGVLSEADLRPDGQLSPELFAAGRKALWRPYCQMATADEAVHVVAAEGVWLELADGSRWIDGISSWWTACHGHRHPHLVKAIVDQAQRLPHVMLGGIDHPQILRLAARLAALMPGELNHAFFSDSGSVAIEVAMKMATQYWLNRGQTGRNRFVCLQHGYHGDTSGAMSVCDPEDSMHRHFRGFLLEQFPSPLPDSEAGWDRFATFLQTVRDRCAGIVFEPLVQGAAGMRFYSVSQLRRLGCEARKAGLLLIADEIATGFWRTGRLLACDWAELVPDVVCLGKSLTGGTLPMAVTMATSAVFDAFYSSSPEHALMHGPTYMGNPLCAAAANASLDLFEQEPAGPRVEQIAHLAKDWLQPMTALAHVREVRCLGGFLAVETQTPFDRSALRPLLREHAVWLRPIGHTMYAAPPFTIGENELRQVVAAMEAAVRWQAR